MVPPVTKRGGPAVSLHPSSQALQKQVPVKDKIEEQVSAMNVEQQPGTDGVIVICPRSGWVEPGWIVGATWFFVGLGIAVRLVRYFVNYPIWHDEAFLAVNFWDRGYVDLLRPLDYGQVAPWLFLAIERTAVTWLGYSEPALRLFPTICSVLSLPLLRRIAGRLMRGTPQLLAVAVLAVSFYPIRHGAEIKPYASDLLAALVLLALAVEWVRSPQSSRWWWALTALIPILIALSYPAVFVAGGISLALAPSALRSNQRTVRLGFIIYNLVLVASFLAVYMASTEFQAEAIRDEYRNGCWADAFPPLDRPWAVPLWMVDVHAGTMMAYPAGDRHGASALTLLCVLAGCLVLYRRDQKTTLAVLIAPFGLGLIAAFLGRYPYGGAPRIMQYLAPSICLLMGLGLTVLLSRIRRIEVQRRAFLGILAGLAIVGSGLVIRDLVKPYRVAGDVRTRDFARWFWSERSRQGELACLKSDMGLSFRPRLWRVGMSAVYLFHQRMFSDRHRQRRAADLDPARYSEDRPLRLVAFDHVPAGIPAFDQWLAGVGHSFQLRRTETYVIQPGKPEEDWLRDAYVVLELIPRTESRAMARRSTPKPGGGRF